MLIEPHHWEESCLIFVLKFVQESFKILTYKNCIQSTKGTALQSRGRGALEAAGTQRRKLCVYVHLRK